jgi:hypothetical protein
MGNMHAIVTPKDTHESPLIFNVASLFALTMVISKIVPTPNDDMMNHFKITLLV